jgi:hypothetical protein
LSFAFSSSRAFRRFWRRKRPSRTLRLPVIQRRLGDPVPAGKVKGSGLRLEAAGLIIQARRRTIG